MGSVVSVLSPPHVGSVVSACTVPSPPPPPPPPSPTHLPGVQKDGLGVMALDLVRRGVLEDVTHKVPKHIAMCVSWRGERRGEGEAGEGRGGGERRGERRGREERRGGKGRGGGGDTQ